MNYKHFNNKIEIMKIYLVDNFLSNYQNELL